MNLVRLPIDRTRPATPTRSPGDVSSVFPSFPPREAAQSHSDPRSTQRSEEPIGIKSVGIAWMEDDWVTRRRRPQRGRTRSVRAVQTSSGAEDPGTGGHGLLHVKYRMHVLQADNFIIMSQSTVALTWVVPLELWRRAGLIPRCGRCGLSQWGMQRDSNSEGSCMVGAMTWMTKQHCCLY